MSSKYTLIGPGVGGGFDPDNPTFVVTEYKDLEGGGMLAVGTDPVEVEFTGETRVILITADADNQGWLYVGKSDVDSDGNNAFTLLGPGESQEMQYNDSTNPLYVVASIADQNFWRGAYIK